MKTLIVFYILLMASIVKADNIKYSCIQNNELPHTTGYGNTEQTAWTDMVEKCVNIQVEEYEELRGDLTEERKLLFIDSCINRKCTTIIEESEGKAVIR